MRRVVPWNKRFHKELAAIMVQVQKWNLPEDVERRFMSSLLWCATENNENGKQKYFGQPYWSIGALKQVMENLKNNRPIDKDIRHEHAIPKSIIRDMIVKNIKESKVKRILNNLSVAVIVSKEEDEELNKAGLRSKMPKGVELKINASKENVFSRYITAKIKVCSVFDYKLLESNDFKKLTNKMIEDMKSKSLI